MKNKSFKEKRNLEIFVYEQMELFAKNPSNSNKYFTNLLTEFESQLTLQYERGVLDGVEKTGEGWNGEHPDYDEVSQDILKSLKEKTNE